MADRRPDAPDESRATDRNLGGECDGDSSKSKSETDAPAQGDTEILLGKEQELPDPARDRDDEDLSTRTEDVDHSRANVSHTSSGWGVAEKDKRM